MRFPMPPSQPVPRRPIAFVFDFVEVGGGAGSVTRVLGDSGLCVGPLIDPSRSIHYDLLGDYACEWLCWLLGNGRVAVILLWCLNATWITVARPRLRTKAFPLGFGPRCPRIMLANRLLSRQLVLAYVALRSGRAACFVFARGSLALHTPQVLRLLDHDGVRLISTDACSYTSDQQRDQPRGGLRVATCQLRRCFRSLDDLWPRPPPCAAWWCRRTFSRRRRRRYAT